ncbi:MAG: hypothetical protein EA380_05445, partial [Phycisphaeraceae bacterium]
MSKMSGSREDRSGSGVEGAGGFPVRSEFREFREFRGFRGFRGGRGIRGFQGRWARSWWAGVVLFVVCVAMYLPGLFTIPPVDRDESRFA